MNLRETRWKIAVAVAGLLGIGGASAAGAREPGVPPVMPPGQTMGTPIAAPLPPGLYANLSTGYYDTKLRDRKGHSAGQSATVIDPTLQLIWAPDWRFLDANVKMFVVQPIVHVDQKRTDPFPPPQQGKGNRVANGNLHLHPLDLTWTLSPGLFLNGGLSVFAPTGQWGSSSFIDIGANFWTVSPSIAVTYLRDGWNASLQSIYFSNTRNETTKYQSGDELTFSGTLTKDIGAGLNVGPVAYYYKQVTDDVNGGRAYGGAIQGADDKLGVGAAINTRIGPINLLLMYTEDVYVRNTLSGGKLWLTIGYKFD